MENRNEWSIKELSPEKLYALEMLARRQRAAEVRRIMAGLGRFVKSVATRLTARGGNEVRHA